MATWTRRGRGRGGHALCLAVTSTALATTLTTTSVPATFSTASHTATQPAAALTTTAVAATGWSQGGHADCLTGGSHHRLAHRHAHPIRSGRDLRVHLVHDGRATGSHQQPAPQG